MTHPAVRFALASVALLLIWTDPPSARPETNLRLDVGTVAGTITVAPVSRPPAVVDYIARSVRRPPATTQSELRNVVLYVDGAPPPTVLPTETVAIRQIAETFEPRVLAVTRGSTVEFPNDDPFFHNVFSLSRAASFDLGRYERGTSRSRTLHEAGFVKVFCDLHSYMSAVIVVLDHPYFAAPGDDGRFVIENVPPGTLTISAWHERIGESSKTVEVTPGERSHVNFVLPVLDR